MQISSGQALSLLHKWFDEKTPLKIMLASSNDSFTVRVMGLIRALTGDAVIIGATFDTTEAPAHYIAIKPSECRAYDYKETKDLDGESEDVKQYLADAHGIAGLSIVLADKDPAHTIRAS